MPSPSAADSLPTPRTWTSQGLQLAYADWGNEGAPPLLLLHGNSDHARSWDWTAQALRGDFHVIAPDLRGHGDSQWSPDGAYLAPYHLMDFADLMETLKLAPVNIVAHSFGGVVALRYAALYPDRVRKLVIIDGQGPSKAILERWDQIGAVKRTRDWIDKRHKFGGRTQRVLASVEDAAKRLREENASLTEERAHHLAQYAVRPAPGGFVWKHDPQVRAFAFEDFTLETPAVWREITAPVLFLYATQSWKYDPDAAALEQHFRDCRSQTFECGHWIHHDRFEAFIGAVRAFL